MTIPDILRTIERSIKKDEERQYFLIHEARYKYILQKIVNFQAGPVAGFLPRIPARGPLLGSPSNHATRYHLRILDVGCFPYHLGAALEMMTRFPESCAVNSRIPGIKMFDVYGISSIHEPIKNKKVKICNIETDKFPYKDNFFDIVLCSEVLEHLPQAPLHAIQEMYRVTAPQGHVLITAPNIARSINRVKLLLGKNVSYPLSHVVENAGKGSNLYHRHNREYTLREITTLLLHAKYFVETAEHFISYTPFRRRNKKDALWKKAGKLTNFALMNVVSSLRDTLLVVGRK